MSKHLNPKEFKKTVKSIIDAIQEKHLLNIWEKDLNLDYHLEVTITVKEARRLALEAGLAKGILHKTSTQQENNEE